jgi:hypothetical protein
LKLFLDANILFTAAHRPSGKSAFVIEKAREGFWQVVTCQLAIDEARRNLEAKYPKAVDSFDRLLKDVGLVPTIVGPRCPIDLPKKDIPIFLSAWRSGATHLLTGDLRDFGRFMNQPKKTRGVLIQTVAAFLEGQ